MAGAKTNQNFLSIIHQSCDPPSLLARRRILDCLFSVSLRDDITQRQEHRLRETIASPLRPPHIKVGELLGDFHATVYQNRHDDIIVGTTNHSLRTT